nr:MAG TPA: hypothetical protein [Herelleviridae sp.]DAZ76933.1 MAG TPA: hypothetical protein [Caudoviricetes sp.]
MFVGDKEVLFSAAEKVNMSRIKIQRVHQINFWCTLFFYDFDTLHISSISCSDKYKGIPHFSSKKVRTYSVESILAPYMVVLIGV